LGEGNAGTLIDDLQINPVADLTGLDADRSVRRGGGDGVFDEVGDGPLK
jgi:hypothetical protein